MEALRKTGAAVGGAAAAVGSAAAAPRELLSNLTGSKANTASAAAAKDAQAAVPMPRRAAPDKTGHPELNDYIRARAFRGEVSGVK